VRRGDATKLTTIAPKLVTVGVLQGMVTDATIMIKELQGPD
jgi:hypothetical protein